MPINVNQPQKKESALDKVAKALQIAQSAYGIYAEGSKLSMLRQQEADRQQGIIGPEKMAEYGQHYNLSYTPEDGSFGLKIRRGDEIKDVFLQPKDKTKASPISQTDWLKLTSEGGKEVAPGTPGSMLVSVMGPDGIAKQAGFIPKPFNTAKQDFDSLPPENQKEIEGVATSSGKLRPIVNNLEAALSKLEDPNLSEDQKVTTGKQLLKVLNSSQGSDAVGAEESKRLGSFLELKIANYKEPGSFVGRDLDQFTEQVRNKASELRDTIKANDASIAELYGRKQPTVRPPARSVVAGKPKEPAPAPSGLEAGLIADAKRELAKRKGIATAVKKKPNPRPAVAGLSEEE